jgi:hypothetical protein
MKKETDITGTLISEKSSSEFIVSYTVSNTYDVNLYSDIGVTIPFEKQIIQGIIKNNLLSEKDILFSQTDIDLNGDNDFNDTFPVKIQKNSMSINDIIISPVIRKSVNYQILYPLLKENYNINKISDKGPAFTLRDFSPVSGTITIGLWGDKNTEFIKFKNSLVLIEVVTAETSSGGNILINGDRPFEGTTNETEITNGEKYRRFVAAKNIVINNNSGKDEAVIKNISKPFNIRITYCFAVAENLITLTNKIIEVR